jgi:hypothetical protein
MLMRLLDPVDNFVDGELGRVYLLRVRRRLHLRGVALVAEAEVGGESLLSDLGPVGRATTSALGCVRDEVDLHVGVRADDGADVAALDDGIAMGAELALALPHHLPDLGVARDRGDDAVDPGLPDLLRHILASDEDAVALEGHSLAECKVAQRRAILERDALVERELRQRPVHGARVEVAKAEPRSERTRDGALAGSGGSVDGDDHGEAGLPGREGVEHRKEVGEAYSDGLGALDADALAGDEAGDCGEHGDAVVGGGVNRTPALRAGGNPTHPEAIMRRFDPDS